MGVQSDEEFSGFRAFGVEFSLPKPWLGVHTFGVQTA